MHVLPYTQGTLKKSTKSKCVCAGTAPSTRVPAEVNKFSSTNILLCNETVLCGCLCGTHSFWAKHSQDTRLNVDLTF